MTTDLELLNQRIAQSVRVSLGSRANGSRSISLRDGTELHVTAGALDFIPQSLVIVTDLEKCKCCGAESRRVVGALQMLTNARGERRSVRLALSDISDLELSLPTEWQELRSGIAFCAECLTSASRSVRRNPQLELFQNLPQLKDWAL